MDRKPDRSWILYLALAGVLALAPFAGVLLPARAKATTWTFSTSTGTGSTVGILAGFAVGAGSTSTTAGFPIGNKKWCDLTVCANPSATITGGTAAAYHYQPSVGVWARSAAGDATLTTGYQCAKLPVWTVTVPYGRMDVALSSLTVSAGTTASAHVRCGL